MMTLRALDALRGLAAVYVMLGHARWLLWGGNAEFVQSGERGVGFLLALLSSSVRYGHEAVFFFFLLSGFCIHYRQATALAKTGTGLDRGGLRFDVGRYGWRRLRRLFPPIAVALVLTAALDTLGSGANPSFYAGQTAYPLINDTLGHPSHSIPTFLGNLAFQATFVVPSFGTDGPLWSLSFEFWFYVLYPLVFLVSSRLGPKGLALAAVIVSGLSLVAHVDWLPWWVQAVLTNWIVWIAGSMIAEARVGRVRLPGLGWLAPAALVGVLMLALGYPRGISDTVRDLLWSAALAVLFAYFMLAAPAWLRSSAERWSGWLAPIGAISYSLYVTHFPWLAFLSAWWLSSHDRLPLGAELVVPGVASTLVLGGACWYVVERHFVGESSGGNRSRALSRRTAIEGRPQVISP